MSHDQMSAPDWSVDDFGKDIFKQPCELVRAWVRLNFVALPFL